MITTFSIIPILLLSALSERLLSFPMLGMQISFGDLLLIISPLIFIEYSSIKLRTIILLLGISLGIMIHSYTTSGNIALNSSISIPLKIMMSIFIYKSLKINNFSRLDYINVYLVFLLLSVGAIFFSDGSPFFSFEYLNRNETLNYMIPLLMLITIYSFKHNRYRKLLYSAYSILLFTSIIVQSRQAILGVLLGLLIYIFFFKKGRKFLLIFVFFVISYVSVFNNTFNSQLFADKYTNQRISTVVSLSPNTRSDEVRLQLIYTGMEGFLGSPIFGNGLQSFKSDNEYGKVAHNSYISTLYEFGTIGVLLILVFFKQYFYQLVSLKRGANKYSQLLIIPVTAFYVQLFFIESFGKYPLYIVIPIIYYILSSEFYSRSFLRK
jgi:O-antigen ligase